MAEIKAVATRHFPQIVWREKHKKLWNPIQRKALKNLPEERVRLRILEYLMHSGWSKHRISTEEAIDLPQKEAAHRTDLICYTREFRPFLLVECKAENVKLSNQTAEQIARYNQKVDAPYLLLTNGRTDFWYQINEEASVRRLSDIPADLPSPKIPDRDFSYWQQRGFAGKKANPALRKWLVPALGDTFSFPDSLPLHYLSFNNPPGDVALNNYYRIFSSDEYRLALSFTATPFGGNRLIGILNKDGKNEAVLELNLDLLFDQRTPNATVYWTGGPKNIDAARYINPDSETKPGSLGSQIFNVLSDMVA